MCSSDLGAVETQGNDIVPEAGERRLLAVGDEDAPARRQPGRDPGEELAAVRMARIHVELTDPRPNGHFLTVDADGGNALLEQGADRARRLVADEQNRGLGAPEVVLEVVADTACLAHAAAGDDDRAGPQPPQSLALLDRFDEVDVRCTERTVALPREPQPVTIFFEHRGCAQGER